MGWLRQICFGSVLLLLTAAQATADGPKRAFLRNRPQLSSSTPLLITGLEQRNLDQAALTANDTSVAFAYDTSKFIEHILRVLPDTTTIGLIIGDSPLEKFWVEEMRRDFRPFADRVTIEWFNKLSLADMEKRAAAMEPRSVLLYGTVR